VGDHLEFRMEGILKSKSLQMKDKEYLVKWRGYHEKEATWVLAKDMGNARKVIENFERNRDSRGIDEDINLPSGGGCPLVSNSLHTIYLFICLWQ
jgi:hypothetical protein